MLKRIRMSIQALVLLASLSFSGERANSQTLSPSTSPLTSTGATLKSLPLSEKGWISLPYRKIPPNQVSFGDSGIAVQVKSSAGPIVHKLESPSKVRSLHVKGKVVGKKTTESSSFDEDSVLRLGLVAVGKQTLSGAKRWFAPDWVKTLFKLVPENSGLDKIYFFNVTDREELIGKSRTHPKSDLIVETVSAKLDPSGNFDLNKPLETPIETAAVWISIDGDDSKSEFVSTISEIKLGIAE